jgi:hypothetical protein
MTDTTTPETPTVEDVTPCAKCQSTAHTTRGHIDGGTPAPIANGHIDGGSAPIANGHIDGGSAPATTNGHIDGGAPPKN